MEDFILKYNIFYFIILLFIVPFAVYTEGKNNRKNYYDSIVAIIILVISIYAVGFRDFKVGVDTAHYLRDFELVSFSHNLKEALKTIRGGSDPLFTMIAYFASKIGNDRFYICLLAVLFICPLGFFIFKNTKGNRLLLLLAFFSIYSFKWMAVNTVRSGIAVAFSLLFLYYLNKGNYRKSILYAIVSLSFHVSAILMIAASFGARIIKKLWVIYLILFFCSLLAFFGLGINNIPIVSEIDRLATYVDGLDNYKTGFSFTYWLYNILISIYFIFMNRRIKDRYYLHLGKVFMLLSSVYFLSFNISFSDRIGVFSWALIPILIAYPFITYKIISKLQGSILIAILLCFQLLAIIYLKR